MINNFRKKPVVIQAVQWIGKNHDECKQFLGDSYVENLPPRLSSSIFIATLEGVHEASLGDWLIRGVAGEHYPCKPEIFDKTYELAESAPATATN